MIDRTGDPGTGCTGGYRFLVEKKGELVNSGGLYPRRCSSRNRSSGIIMNRIIRKKIVSWSSGTALPLAQ